MASVRPEYSAIKSDFVEVPKKYRARNWIMAGHFITVVN